MPDDQSEGKVDLYLQLQRGILTSVSRLLKTPIRLLHLT
jgi:hypothetical protein